MPAHLPGTTASPFTARREVRVAASEIQLAVVMYPPMVLQKGTHVLQQLVK